MLLKVVQQESSDYPPSLGEPHEWSPEIIATNGSHWSMAFPKLLVGLGLGITYNFLFTGQEEAITQWLLEQPDESVLFSEYFRQAYRLNQGDIYLALLTMENSISKDWLAPNRNSLPHVRKFKPMINEYNESPDRFGSYYHFIGTVLYGYAAGEGKAGRMALLETIGSHILSGFESEPQENYANKYGAKIGGRFKKALLAGAHLKMSYPDEVLNPDYYLDHSEDFTDRVFFVQEASMIVKYYESGSGPRSVNQTTLRTVKLTNSKEEFIGCHAKIYQLHHSGKYSVYEHDYDGISFGPAKFAKMTYLSSLTGVARVRGKISNCKNKDGVFWFSYNDKGAIQ